MKEEWCLCEIFINRRVNRRLLAFRLSEQGKDSIMIKRQCRFNYFTEERHKRVKEMLDQKQFLEEYNLEQSFEKSRLTWETLQEIYEDYEKTVYSLMQKLSDSLTADLERQKKEICEMHPEERSALSDIHVIYGRAKEPGHVIEKIIRKIGNEDSQKYQNINVGNYRDILRDLIGVRIIVIKKEGWKAAHNIICSLFGTFCEGKPKAYVCYGDRKIFDEKSIDVDYTVKGYRSQHYIVRYKENYAEIQVRTLAEEVYGEFDHRVRYPYYKDNKFLIRYTNMISRGIAELDDMISTCMQLDKDLLDRLDQEFFEDSYVDWSKEQGRIGEAAVPEQKEKRMSDSVEEIIKGKLL